MCYVASVVTSSLTRAVRYNLRHHPWRYFRNKMTAIQKLGESEGSLRMDSARKYGEMGKDR